MSVKNIAVANTNCLINFTPVSVPPDALYQGDIPYNKAGVAFTPSTKVKCVDDFALLTSFTFTWTTVNVCPFTSVTYDFVSGAGNIVASSLKCKCETNPPLRKDDVGTCAGSWKLKLPPYSPLVCSCSCKVSNAGQVKVSSN